MSEEDSTRLWFLLRNPRALGEVEEWLKEKRQEYEDNYNSPISEAADRIKIITIDELLADIQKQFDLNFPPTNNSKPMKPTYCTYKKDVPNCPTIECTECPHCMKPSDKLTEVNKQ